MVNDVHRTIKTEDEYLEYSRLVTDFEFEKMDEFILSRALETTKSERIQKILSEKLCLSEDAKIPEISKQDEQEEKKDIVNVDNVEKQNLKEDDKLSENIEKENDTASEIKSENIEIQVEDKPKRKRRNVNK